MGRKLITQPEVAARQPEEAPGPINGAHVHAGAVVGGRRPPVINVQR